MSLRKLLILFGLIALLAAGCRPQAAPAAIPTVAALPTPTPVPPTATYLPPTWTPAPSPTPACDRMISGAVQNTGTVCGGMAVGEVCLVAAQAAVVPQDPGVRLAFGTPGDRVSLSLLSRIETSAYDPASATWGLLRFQIAANAPGISADQTVTGLLFGQAIMLDGGDGGTPFQSLLLQTGFADSQCASAPRPGALFQSVGAQAADLKINGLTIRFDGTLVARAVGGQSLSVGVLAGSAQTTAADGTTLQALPGTALEAPLDPAGMVQLAALEIHPLDTTLTGFLPLTALPRPVAIGPAVLPTQVLPTQPALTLQPTITRQPSETPPVPFAGTPPNGVQAYDGQRIVPGQTVTGSIRAGGSEAWVFSPVGTGPDFYDAFEVTAFGGWDPVLTIESATWGVYVQDYDASVGDVEAYTASLAGSGGDWRIVIRGKDDAGGGYTLRYICQGPCALLTPEAAATAEVAP